MADPRVVQTAFKEWASIIRALEEGDQICLVRTDPKDHPRFDLKRRRFWLVPTYDHQSEEMIQPPYRDYLEETEGHHEELGEDQIRVSSWAEAKTLIQINKQQRLNWLTDYVAYSPRALQNRFQFQPGEAVFLLIARVYKLPDPRVLDVPPDYHSCSADDRENSWIRLKQRIPLQADNPAVDGDDFEQRKNEIRERFVFEEDEKPEPLMF